MDAGKSLLGYVICTTTPDGAFLGGALITDLLGLPIEFRHTEPIIPTRLQRILYGRVLEAYMHNDVVTSALLAAVDGAPPVYIVGDPTYLSGADGFGTPAIWVSEARNVPAKEPGTRQDLSAEEFILHLGPGNGPVRVRMPSRSPKDPADNRKEEIVKLLLNAAQSMEIIEPLRRVEEALRLLSQEEQLAVSSLRAA